MKTILAKFIEAMNTHNVGTLDRTLRITVGLTLIGLGIYRHENTIAAVALGLLGINVTMTGIRGVCSIYYMLGYSTCPITQKPNPNLKKSEQ